MTNPLLSRRKLFTGAAMFIAAPAIIRVASLMPVKAWADAVSLDPGGVSRSVYWLRFSVSPQTISDYPINWLETEAPAVWAAA
jgi:hypothetical protein